MRDSHTERLWCARFAEVPLEEPERATLRVSPGHCTGERARRGQRLAVLPGNPMVKRLQAANRLFRILDVVPFEPTRLSWRANVKSRGVLSAPRIGTAGAP